MKYRKATTADLDIYYEWVNDPLVRSQSFNSDLISFNEHSAWFHKRLADKNCVMYVFLTEEDLFVGQVRIEVQDETSCIINVSIDKNFRRKALGAKILRIASSDFLANNPGVIINAFIKDDNISSKIIFERAGFMYKGDVLVSNFKSVQYVKYEDRQP